MQLPTTSSTKPKLLDLKIKAPVSLCSLISSVSPRQGEVSCLPSTTLPPQIHIPSPVTFSQEPALTASVGSVSVVKETGQKLPSSATNPESLPWNLKPTHLLQRTPGPAMEWSEVKRNVYAHTCTYTCSRWEKRKAGAT